MAHVNEGAPTQSWSKMVSVGFGNPKVLLARSHSNVQGKDCREAAQCGALNVEAFVMLKRLNAKASASSMRLRGALWALCGTS